MSALLVDKKLIRYYVILIFFSTAVYINSIDNEFLWDDEFLIQKNNYLDGFHHLPDILVTNSTAGFGGKDNFYRPTQIVYYLLINTFWGKSKRAFHGGNILLHIINALLFFFLIVRLTNNNELAFFSSLLWLVHPTHTEAITYISGTADPMGAVFGLSSLLLFKRNNYKRIILSLLFYILALMSKEAMVILPGLVLLLVAYEAKPGDRYDIKKYFLLIPYLVIALLYLYSRKTFLNFDETFSFYKESNIYTENISYRIYTFLAATTEYMSILFYPIDLHMERSFPVYTSLISLRVVLGLLLYVGATAVCIYYYRIKREIYLFCLLWFLISFIPMMGILIPVNSFILEHWLYLPSLGFFIAAALVIKKINHRYLRYGIISFVVLILGTLTHYRNRDWKDPITFYSNILKHSEGSARVHNNLAMAYSDQNNLDQAVYHYTKAIELGDIYPQTHYNLARVYIKKALYGKALEHLTRSLKIDGSFIYARKLKEEVERFLAKSNERTIFESGPP